MLIEKANIVAPIFILGYMGSGKSTIGKQLSKKLDIQFIDLDLEIENKIGSTIAEFFSQSSEHEFRIIEKQTLRDLELKAQIVSVGGGTPCFFDNLEFMNTIGRTIYLKGSPMFLSSRLKKGKNKRPLISGLSDDELPLFIEKHLEERKKFYEKAQITVGLPVHSVDEIIAQLR